MAEVQILTQPVNPPADQNVNQDEAAGFAESLGMDGGASAPVAQTSQTPPTGDTVTETPPKEAPPPEVVYVQITKDQFDRYELAMKDVADLKADRQKIYGNIGGLKSELDRVKTAPPPAPRRTTPLALAKVRQFVEPAFADAIAEDLKEIEAAPAPAQAVDQDVVARLVEQKLLDRALENLNEEYPEWRSIVGVVTDANGVASINHNSPYRLWLAKKDAQYQQRINNTKNADQVRRSINGFLADQAAAQRVARPAPPKPPAPPNKNTQVRNARLTGAVTPRGEGTPPAPRGEQTELEGLLSAFN